MQAARRLFFGASLVRRLAIMVVAFGLAAGAVLAPTESRAQTRVAPESRAQVQLSLAPVVKQAAPAVVNVYGARVERRSRSRTMDDFFERFFGEEVPGVPRGRSQTNGCRSVG